MMLLSSGRSSFVAFEILVHVKQWSIFFPRCFDGSDGFRWIIMFIPSNIELLNNAWFLQCNLHHKNFICR